MAGFRREQLGHGGVRTEQLNALCMARCRGIAVESVVVVSAKVGGCVRGVLVEKGVVYVC